MRTYFVYINRDDGQWKVAATQDWRKLDGSSRDKVRAIWRVTNCHGSEHAKGRVMMFQTFPVDPTKVGITRIR